MVSDIGRHYHNDVYEEADDLLNLSSVNGYWLGFLLVASGDEFVIILYFWLFFPTADSTV